MQALQEALVNLLIVIVGGAVTIGTTKTTAYLKEKGILAQVESKQNYVDIAVQAVQQMYQESNGDEKLEVAKDYVIKLFRENNIPVSDGEIKLLIESAVKGMKDGIEQGESDVE